MARVGQGFTYTDTIGCIRACNAGESAFSGNSARNMMVEASYWGQWATGCSLSTPVNALPDRTWNTANLRNNTIATM